MDKINFESGTKIKSATVTIDNVDHEVQPAQYSGNTPLNPTTLNLLQANIENEFAKNKGFSAGQYFNNTGFSIPNFNGIYLIWCASSGSTADSSLGIVNEYTTGRIKWTNFGGGMITDVTLTNGTLNVKTLNKYGYYGYIKLN